MTTNTRNNSSRSLMEERRVTSGEWRGKPKEQKRRVLRRWRASPLLLGHARLLAVASELAEQTLEETRYRGNCDDDQFPGFLKKDREPGKHSKFGCADRSATHNQRRQPIL